MCKCLKKQLVRTLGLVSTLFYGILSIICIFVQGYDFQQLDMSWTNNGPWRFLAIFQLACVVCVVVLFIVGMIVFGAGECKTIQFIYVVIIAMTGLFSFSITVITLIAGAIGKGDATLACQQNYQGVFEYFHSLDVYFHLVDQKLCTSECPCLFTNQSAIDDFEDAPDGIKFSDDALTEDIVSGSVNFGQCTESTKLAVFNSFAAIIESLDNIGKFDQDLFAVYWGRIEKKFNCVGWCTTSYKNPIASLPDIMMSKYLFSDVNGGVVKNRGCMERMVDWIPKMLNTYGAVLLIITVGQFASFVFAISLLCDHVEEGSNYPDNEIKRDIEPTKQMPITDNRLLPRIEEEENKEERHPISTHELHSINA